MSLRQSPGGSQVVVFGEAIWDFFPRRPGDSIRSRRLEVRHPGGAPANVARTLARLGVTTRLVTALGEDPLGDAMIDALAADGVMVDSITRVAARTAVTFVEVRCDGGRSFLFYRHPSADMMLEPGALDPALFHAGWLHLGSSTLSRPPSRDATLRAIELAREAGARVSIDANVRPHLWADRGEIARVVMPILREADLVKVSEEDLAGVGLSPDLDGGRALHQLRGGRPTLLTLAARGATAWIGDTHLVPSRFGTRRPRVVDTTGAGDAFTAGVLATLVHHVDIVDAAGFTAALVRRALEVGCALGARAIGRLGATAALRSLASARTTIGRPFS